MPAKPADKLVALRTRSQSTPWCAMPGSAACRKAMRWPCSRSAAMAAVNCSRSRTSTCWCWPSPTCNSRRNAALGALRCVAVGRGPASQPRSALRRRVHRGRRRPDRADRVDRGASAGGLGRGGGSAARGRRAGSACGRRVHSSRPRSPSSASATRASATPRTTWNPTSRTARAACATCTCWAGWRLRSFGVRDLRRAGAAWAMLGADEAIALERERRVLCRLRFGLHLRGRPPRGTPALRLPEAARRHAWATTDDTRQRSAVEKMMQGFYPQRGDRARINDRLLQRFEEQCRRQRGGGAVDAEGFERRHGYLATPRAGLAAARSGQCVCPVRDLGRGHRRARPAFADRARAGARRLPGIAGLHRAVAPALRARFMALLRGPQPVKALERMARLGVLGRWICRRSRRSPGACSSTCSTSTRSTSTRWRC